MNTKLAALAAAALLAWSAQAAAGAITAAAFSGSETIIDFNTVPAARPPVGPFSIGDATFSESSTGVGSPGWHLLDGFFVPGSRALTDNHGISDIVIDFGTSYQRVGLDVGIGPATYEVRFFDNSLGLLGSTSRRLPSNDHAFFFAGWEDMGGISRVQIIETSGENGLVGGLDNLRFETMALAMPEPATLALLGVGLAGLGWTRRRKTAG